jgi:hypothetical protein
VTRSRPSHRRRAAAAAAEFAVAYVVASGVLFVLSLPMSQVRILDPDLQAGPGVSDQILSM